MRILYITLEDVSFHKGSVVHINEIIQGFRRLGHFVGLVAYSSNKSEKTDKFYNLKLLPISFLKTFKLMKQPYIISSILLFIRLLKITSKYDVIYARDYHTAAIALLPRIIFNKKLVFEINGLASEEQRLKKDSYFNKVLCSMIQETEKMATKYSDRIISVTPQIASHLVHQFYCPIEKVEVISNGANTNIFYPIENENLLLLWRQKLGIEKEERVISFVGNLAPWQGIEYLIKIAPKIIQSNKNIKFLIIGNGILKEKLEGEVRRLGLSHHFLFTGMVQYQEIPFYINIADICVTLKKRLKSGYSPIKLYEYMACGKPVVASRVEGLEFVEVEGVGCLVDPEDAIIFEKILLTLLKDTQKRFEMGRKGFQLARGRFTWDSATRRIEKILESLV